MPHLFLHSGIKKAGSRKCGAGKVTLIPSVTIFCFETDESFFAPDKDGRLCSIVCLIYNLWKWVQNFEYLKSDMWKEWTRYIDDPFNSEQEYCSIKNVNFDFLILCVCVCVCVCVCLLVLQSVVLLCPPIVFTSMLTMLQIVPKKKRDL